METIVAVGLIVGIGLGLILLSRPAITVKERATIGVAFAKAIYSDEKGTKLLVAPQYDLQGKPDYIFQTLFGGRYIPVEVKSGVAKEDEPHEGDLMQLVAYFLIIEEAYGKRPPYGKLIYKNKTFKVRNTTFLRTKLKRILREMRAMLKGHTDIETEVSFVKCRNCICQQTVCELGEECQNEYR